MANHKSATKRARQSPKRADRNRSKKNAVKTWEKKLRQAIQGKDLKAAQEVLKSFSSQIDRAAKKSAIHYKSAARKISRLAKQVASLTK